MVHRSAHKARTQALLQIRDLITTAPDELRDQLRGLRRRELLAVCAAFRPAERDDLSAITKLSLGALARRIAELDAALTDLDQRRRRITAALAPALVAAHGKGPDTATGLLLGRRGQPRPAPQRTNLVSTAGGQPDPGLLRQSRRASAQPRRRPTGQQRPVAHRHRPDEQPSTDQGLRPTPHRGRTVQARDRAMPHWLA
jgi:hypothetical protein